MKYLKKIFNKFFKYIVIYLMFIFGFLRNKLQNKITYKRINIIYNSKKSGLSIVTSDIYKALKNLKTPVNLIYFDVNNLKKKTYYRDSLNIFVGNPDILPLFAVLNPSFFFSYNIGVWFWELDKLPFNWKLTRNFIDQIWVQSDYLVKIFKNINTKIIHIPFCLNFLDFKKKNFSKKIKPSPNKKFTFFYNFDFLSHIQRKNPFSLISSFNIAFNTDDNVELIIKCSNGLQRPKDYEILKKIASSQSNIKIIDSFLSRYDFLKLLASCDCYISLHRAEGLGLGMAEAMLLGIPTIATAYSGNLEFMNRKNSLLVDYDLVEVKNKQYIYSHDCKWAEPNIIDAAQKMKLIFQDYDLYKMLSRNAIKSTSSNNFFNFKIFIIALINKQFKIF